MNRARGTSSGLAAGAVAGSPLGIVLVWALDNYVLPEPMPGEIAVAVGSLVTSALAYIFRRK